MVIEEFFGFKNAGKKCGVHPIGVRLDIGESRANNLGTRFSKGNLKILDVP